VEIFARSFNPVVMILAVATGFIPRPSSECVIFFVTLQEAGVVGLSFMVCVLLALRGGYIMNDMIGKLLIIKHNISPGAVI